MQLPHQNITPIPNTEPDAVPSLWNERYEQIDANFQAAADALQATEDELAGARGEGHESLGETIEAIVTQIGGISGTLTGLASPASVQQATNLDWLYRNRRISFELFASGYSIHNRNEIAVIQGVIGDDSLDIADTSTIRVGAEYLLSAPAVPGEEGEGIGGASRRIELIKVAAILSGQRLRLASNLSSGWNSTATLRGSTFAARAGGGVDAVPGDQWVSQAINLGDDNTARAVVIRRSLNSANVRLFFRDAYATEWVERPWSTRRSGGGTTGVPEGMADYEYVVPMRGDGYLRVLVEDEGCTIMHIVGLGAGTGLGGYINPQMRPDAPTITNPLDGASNVTERPTLSLNSYHSPAGNAFATAQFQLSTSAAFSTVTHDSGERNSMTYAMPAGVLLADTTYYLRGRVKDVAGLLSDWSVVASFSTKASFAYVNAPVMTAPTDGQSEIPETPTLQSAPFAATGASDTHSAAQWQIRLLSGSWTSPLHDSGESASSLTSYSVPAGILQPGQNQYAARVRHKGTTLGWSEWSSDITFTTKQQFAQVLGIVLTATGGGAGTWQRIDENFNGIVTTAATFANHPVYAGIVDQIIDGQNMVKVPKFYVRSGTVPQGPYLGKRYWLISDEPLTNYDTHPAFMRAGNPIDQFWVGKYQGTADGSKLGSKAGVTPLVSIDFPTMVSRAAARNVSGVTGFQLWDYYQLSAIQLLALIEMGGADSQSLIGQGHVSGSSALATDNATVAQATWRGIVGLWGNVWQMVQGLQTDGSSRFQIWDKNGNQGWVTTAQSAPANGYHVTFSVDSGASHDLTDLFVPATTNTTASNGTTGDHFYTNPNCVAYHGGDWGDGANAGLFCLNVSYAASYANATIGGRLAKV